MAPSVDLDDRENEAYNRPAENAPSGDPRDRKPKYDLYKVDYKWVDNQKDKRELRAAYQALKEDGGFPDLMNHTLKRLKVVDPKFKTTEDFNNYTAEEERAANEDVLAFLEQMNESDKKIRGDSGPAKPARSKDIFDEET